jgi:hypothetical protein
MRNLHINEQTVAMHLFQTGRATPLEIAYLAGVAPQRVQTLIDDLALQSRWSHRTTRATYLADQWNTEMAELHSRTEGARESIRWNLGFE